MGRPMDRSFEFTINCDGYVHIEGTDYGGRYQPELVHLEPKIMVVKLPTQRVIEESGRPPVVVPAQYVVFEIEEMMGFWSVVGVNGGLDNAEEPWWAGKAVPYTDFQVRSPRLTGDDLKKYADEAVNILLRTKKPIDIAT